MVEEKYPTKEQEQEQEHHRIFSYHERCRIEEDIHGVKSMGLSKEEETKQHVALPALEFFQVHLEHTLRLDRQARAAAAIAADNESSSGDDGDDGNGNGNGNNNDNLTTTNRQISTDEYELCLRRNILYVTGAGGDVSLRLMCLRADFWNPKKACERFLRHLKLLYFYYGEEGLRGPLRLQLLLETNNNNNNNEGGGGGNGNTNDLLDMQCLESGQFSLLPSRDRTGRRVVFLQPLEPSTDTPLQRELKAYSTFKAMLYFFSTIARQDIDAQRNGLVIVLNSTMTSTALQQDYLDFYQSIPIRCSVIHACCDNNDNNNNNLCSSGSSRSRSNLDRRPRNNVMMLLRSSMIGGDCDDADADAASLFAARIRVYKNDACHRGTNNDLGTFGIPVHEVPVTPTGTIKRKSHKQWIKIQKWLEQRERQQAAHANAIIIIECPAVNDVLFSRGGKFWNGMIKFQRGNLEFMDYLESEVLPEVKTKKLKKNKKMCLAVVETFAAKTGGRFLVSATDVVNVEGCGLQDVPEGCWVELPMDSSMLMKKIHETIRNHDNRLKKKLKTNIKRREPPPPPSNRDDDIIIISLVSERRISRKGRYYFPQ